MAEDFFNVYIKQIKKFINIMLDTVSKQKLRFCFTQILDRSLDNFFKYANYFLFCYFEDQSLLRIFRGTNFENYSDFVFETYNQGLLHCSTRDRAN